MAEYFKDMDWILFSGIMGLFVGGILGALVSSVWFRQQNILMEEMEMELREKKNRKRELARD
jgi:hypothetical protein